MFLSFTSFPPALELYTNTSHIYNSQSIRLNVICPVFSSSGQYTTHLSFSLNEKLTILLSSKHSENVLKNLKLLRCTRNMAWLSISFYISRLKYWNYPYIAMWVFLCMAYSLQSINWQCSRLVFYDFYEFKPILFFQHLRNLILMYVVRKWRFYCSCIWLHLFLSLSVCMQLNKRDQKIPPSKTGWLL